MSSVDINWETVRGRFSCERMIMFGRSEKFNKKWIKYEEKGESEEKGDVKKLPLKMEIVFSPFVCISWFLLVYVGRQTDTFDLIY